MKNATPQQSTFIDACSAPGNIAVNAVAGAGKCLGINTPVLLANGDVIPVQCIEPGMYLAGPTEPRFVLSTATGHGDLVRIDPVKGDSWICNTDHILTLAGTNKRSGQTIDIAVKDYPNFLRSYSSEYKNWKLVRTGIDYWEEIPTPFPAYLIGLWLGDGNSSEPTITTEDLVIRNYCFRIAEHLGYEITETLNHCYSIEERLGLEKRVKPNDGNYKQPVVNLNFTSQKKANPLRQYIRSLSKSGEKLIPTSLLRGSRTQRLDLLAGLIDSDGHLSNGGFEITSKWSIFADDIVALARSLHFAAYKTCKRVNGYPYWRVSISGDTNLIPTKLERKQAPPRKQCKRVAVTGFSITPIGQGDYYGFMLDGDGRFLLGDYTITHNTSVLQAGAAKIRGSGLSTSFSKATVEELSKRMPSNFPAKTLHGLGYQAIKAHLPGVKLDKGDQIYNFLKEWYSSRDAEWTLILPTKQLVEHAQLAGIVPDHPRFLLEDEYENWETLAETFDIPFSPLIHQAARETLIQSNKLAIETGLITFPQMLTLPLFFSIRMSQYPTIICDEVQDLSPLQHALLSRALRQGGRIIVAGDPFQSLFSFAGAMSDSYYKLIRTFNCLEYPLTVSWRCARSIIAEAQQYVPHIEAAPNAPEGQVITHNQLALDQLPSAVICRNNAPIVALALRCLKNGIMAEVAGRDIGSGLKSLTKRIASGKNSDKLSTIEFITRLEDWGKREIARKPRNKQRTQDKIDTLLAFCEHSSTLGDIRRSIDQLFVDENGQRRPADIHCSTVHRFKGKEAPEVLILDPHLMPSKYAEQQWELDAERNIAYVAVTRAQQALHYVTSKNIV